MLLFDAPLTFREFMTHEELPLATLFRQILNFLQGREDAVLFGSQAVNAYCEVERMTQDVDVLSTNAPELAELLRAHLAECFHIAVRVREVADGKGFRVYQARKPRNRHLVDVRAVPKLPSSRINEGIRIIEPSELIAMKVISASQRQGQPKGGTDLVDIQRLLLTFPELKVDEGPVLEALRAAGASDAPLTLWRSIVKAAITPDDEDGY